MCGGARVLWGDRTVAGEPVLLREDDPLIHRHPTHRRAPGPVRLGVDGTMIGVLCVALACELANSSVVLSWISRIRSSTLPLASSRCTYTVRIWPTRCAPYPATRHVLERSDRLFPQARDDGVERISVCWLALACSGQRGEQCDGALGEMTDGVERGLRPTPTLDLAAATAAASTSGACSVTCSPRLAAQVRYRQIGSSVAAEVKGPPRAVAARPSEHPSILRGQDEAICSRPCRQDRQIRRVRESQWTLSSPS